MDSRYLEQSINYSDPRDPDLDAPGLREDITFPLENQEISRKNILESLAKAPDLQPFTQNSVVRVRSDVVVKFGESVQIQEAKTMRMVREHAKVSLPEVLDAWTELESNLSADSDGRGSGDAQITYIVMRFIPGVVLESKWPELSPEQRKKLIQDIAQQLRWLHEIKVEKPGPVGGGVKCKGGIFTDYGAGPFDTPEDLAYWLNNRLRVMKSFKRLPQNRPEFSISADELAICHMDLHPRNIIIDDELRPWLVDWGHAGGYPAYFELANLRWTRGMVYLDLLFETLCEESQKPAVARIHEMAFALSVGAACFRADLGVGDEY